MFSTSNAMMTIPTQSKFFEMFLGEEEVINKNEWPVRLKNHFMDIARTALKDKGVSWINPVCTVSLRHPQRYLGGSTFHTLGERLRESIFMPVSMEPTSQDILASAVKEIEGKQEPHLTPELEKQHANHKSERCSKITMDSDKNVTIHTCGGENILKINGDMDHYNGVFNQSEYLYFIPAPGLKYYHSDHSIFEKCFLGTFVAFHSEPRSICCCAHDIRPFLDWISNLFLARRLKDQGETFSKTMSQYSKQLQMLSLLASPLEKLTAALDETIEHTQRLRAILYDPSRAIFAAAPRAMVYFEEGRQLGRGRLSWKAIHDPNKTNTPTEERSVRLSLAAVICEIFGQMDPWPENEGALISRAKELLNLRPQRSSDSIETLRREGDASGSVEQDEKLAFKQLCDTCLAVIGGNVDCFDQLDKYKKAASRFKKVLYRPFKDGDTKYPLEPLLVGLYGFKPDLQLCITANGAAENIISLPDGLEKLDRNLAACELFGKVGLPVPRYAHWLALLFGVIAFAKSEQSGSGEMDKVIVKIDNESVSIVVKFGSGIFDDTGKLYQAMQQCLGRRDASLRYLGNLYKPFVDFVLLAEGKGGIDGDGFSIEHECLGGTKIRTCIAAEKDIFRYSSFTDQTKRQTLLGSDEPSFTQLNIAEAGQDFVRMYFNHDNNAYAVEEKFGKKGERWIRIIDLPNFKDNAWSYSVGEDGTCSPVQKICCFVHDTPNMQRWIDLAKQNVGKICVVFVSRSSLRKQDGWPDNVTCYENPVADLDEEHLEGFFRDAAKSFKRG